MLVQQRHRLCVQRRRCLQPSVSMARKGTGSAFSIESACTPLYSAVRFFAAIIAAVHSSGSGARSPSKAPHPSRLIARFGRNRSNVAALMVCASAALLSATPGPAGALRAARGRGLLAPADWPLFKRPPHGPAGYHTKSRARQARKARP